MKFKVRKAKIITGEFKRNIFYSAFYHAPNALETKRVMAILKTADPYSFQS